MQRQTSQYVMKTLFGEELKLPTYRTRLSLKPFVKWAGGKRQLLPELLKRVPKTFQVYFEPFLGGGALLFALQPQKAVVGDINYDLVNAYKVIKHEVLKLIEILEQHQKKHSEEYYYKIRKIDKNSLNNVERAARFIYLNKTCYNGLYRENSKGEFNVPIGRYKNPTILDRENLLAISEYLNSADVKIIHGDYKHIVACAKKGDFVYFDPPYVPVSVTANFTKYTKSDFTLEDQKELAQVFRQLADNGCYVMLSNSDTEIVRELYKEFNIDQVSANRFINSNSQKRKNHTELIIRNY